MPQSGHLIYFCNFLYLNKSDISVAKIKTYFPLLNENGIQFISKNKLILSKYKEKFTYQRKLSNVPASMYIKHEILISLYLLNILLYNVIFIM